jgi:hypothetical protein
VMRARDSAFGASFRLLIWIAVNKVGKVCVVSCYGLPRILLRVYLHRYTLADTLYQLRVRSTSIIFCLLDPSSSGRGASGGPDYSLPRPVPSLFPGASWSGSSNFLPN